MRLVPLVLASSFALAAGAASATAQSTTVFFEDFESGLGNWTATSIWHLQDTSQPCSNLVAPFPSGTHAAWFGRQANCTFGSDDGWNWFDGDLTLNTPIALPANAGSIELTFSTFSAGEDDGIWDTREAQVSTDGVHWTILPLVYSSTWKTQRYDLATWRGQSIRLRFDFWSGDGGANDGIGWFVDDVRIEASPDPATMFCPGDGTWTACPCANLGAPGNGCASSFNTAGAQLTATGVGQVSADSLVLQSNGTSNSAVTFFQGTDMRTQHWQMVNGDGLLCVTGSLLRIRTVDASGGSASYPGPGDTSISVRGLLPPTGGVRYYQVRYRNAATFCTSGTFNLTNGLIVTWQP